MKSLLNLLRRLLGKRVLEKWGLELRLKLPGILIRTQSYPLRIEIEHGEPGAKVELVVDAPQFSILGSAAEGGGGALEAVFDSEGRLNQLVLMRAKSAGELEIKVYATVAGAPTLFGKWQGQAIDSKLHKLLLGIQAFFEGRRRPGIIAALSLGIAMLAWREREPLERLVDWNSSAEVEVRAASQADKAGLDGVLVYVQNHQNEGKLTGDGGYVKLKAHAGKWSHVTVCAMWKGEPVCDGAVAGMSNDLNLQ
jgi:hypothetical protein